ncbi:MAG: hypothetical protein V2A72_04680 [Candidatus Omnitrophota bacterium]
MRKNIFVLMLVIILAVGLVSSGFCMGQRPVLKKKSLTKPMTAVSKAKGKITACNWRTSTVTISTGTKASLVVDVVKNTVISKTGKAVSINDIKIGDSVTVAYETKENKKIAKSIILQSAAMLNIKPAKRKKQIN